MRHYLLFIVLVLTPVTLFAQIISSDVQTSYSSVNDTVFSEEGPVIVQKVTKSKVIRPTVFTDKWYVSLGLGPHIFMGENEWKGNAADFIVASLDINAGRWFTPYLAVDFNLNFHKFNGIYSPYYGGSAHFTTDEPYGNVVSKKSAEKYYWQKGQYVNGYFRLLLDLSSMHGRNRNETNTHFMPFVGLGYASGTGSNTDANSPTFNFGLIYEVRFTNNISLNVVGRGALLFDRFDGEMTSEHGFDGMAGLNFGIVYRFGKSKNVSIVKQVAPAPAPAVQPAPAPVVVAAPVNIQSEREKLEKQREEIIGMLFPYYSHFTIDDTTLVNREKVNLAVVAKFMNDNPKMKFIVSGYADMQTGTIARNKWLAENRAKRVVQVLVNEFMVDPKQLILESYGGVGNMFYNENQLSRCVIITIKE